MLVYLAVIIVLGLATLGAGLWALGKGSLPRAGKVNTITGFSLAVAGLGLLLSTTYFFTGPESLSSRGQFPWLTTPQTEFGRPQPDRPRAHLTESNILAVAEAALPVDKTPEGSRRLRLLISEDVDHLWLVLKALSGQGEEMQEAIRRDAWAINQALFGDRQFQRIDRIHIIVTHPSGSTAEPDLHLGPVVARITMDRQQYEAMMQGNFQAQRLDEMGVVRWYPPLQQAAGSPPAGSPAPEGTP